MVSHRRLITDATMANILTMLLFPHTQLGNYLKQQEKSKEKAKVVVKNNCPDQSMWGKQLVDNTLFMDHLTPLSASTPVYSSYS